jgi:16S rRNA (guanine(966)-N(2))-methyltransferase RsmD
MKQRAPSRIAPAAAASAGPARRTAERPRGTKAGALPGRVRIIGGSFRRTLLAVTDAPGLRPTPDRVRETLFNWIDHLRGAGSALRALDLFAGTGALGFEMASRGAARVVLVDSNGRVADALRATQRRLGTEVVAVLHADWRDALARLIPERFDLIFVDPPFGSGLLQPAVEAARQCLAPDGLLYVESAQELTADALVAWQLESVREGRVGAVYFHLLRVRSC